MKLRQIFKQHWLWNCICDLWGMNTFFHAFLFTNTCIQTETSEQNHHKNELSNVCCPLTNPENKNTKLKKPRHKQTNPLQLHILTNFNCNLVFKSVHFYFLSTKKLITSTWGILQNSWGKRFQTSLYVPLIQQQCVDRSSCAIRWMYSL